MSAHTHASSMKVAVVGHVELVRFMRVDRSPTPGAILHASESWVEPAGGGGAAAAELARLAGHCTFFTALGNDEGGQQIPATLAELGVEVRGPTRPEPHRQAVTLLDPDGERTITVFGTSQAPSASDGLTADDFKELDAVYYCKGDAEVLRLARHARVLVATARALPTIREAGVRLDALVHSARDPDESYRPGDLEMEPDLIVTTDGGRGGSYWTARGTGRWDPAELPDQRRDTYGAGDCFAAALTHALGQGLEIEVALWHAAARGAAALCRDGALGAASAS